MSSSRHTRIASRSCRFKFSFPFPGPCRADLAALGDEDHVVVRLVAVHEMAEALHDLRIVDRLLPFAFVGVDQLLHVGFELGAYPKRVLAYDLAHVVDAPFEVLQPHAGALQPVAGADVEHQEAVDVLDEGPVVEVRGEEVRVARFHAAVAAHVQIPALLSGNDAHVLALRLGALARAARDRHLHLVRRADAAVAVLDVDRHRDRILDSVTAPGAADARFHGAQRLAVGVAGLEARGDQILPDQRQLLHARAEQVDALGAGNLRIQAVFPRHLAEHDQLLGRDFATGNPRDDRIRAVLLQIGEEVVVRVLQRRVPGLQDHLVPARGEDRREGGLADVAAAAPAVLGDDGVEAHKLAHAYKVEQLLARVVEVLAQMVLHVDAALSQLAVQNLFYERAAAAAGGAGFGRLLQRAEARAACGDRIAQPALAHVVAGADGGRRRQQVHPEALLRAFARRQDQVFGVLGQRQGVQRHLQETAVFVGVADQDRAEQVLAVAGDHEPLVDTRRLVGIDVVKGVQRRAVRVADRTYIHAHELELGAHVGAEELRALLARHVPRGDLRHLVARRNQPIDAAVPLRALAESVDVPVAGLAMIIHHDAAALADRKSGCPSEPITRANARGEHGDVRFQRGAVGEQQLVAASGAADDLLRLPGNVYRYAQCFDLTAQQPPARVVELHGHQTRCKLHHMSLQAKIV